MASSPIDFYFDFSSPYSYIASEWIEALAARHGRSVRWHAILLGATFQAAELKSPVSYPIKREYALHDFARSARFDGVPYVQPEPFPIPTQNAARVFWWLHERDAQQAAAWAHAGLRAYFTRGVALNDVAQLKALAAEHGLDADAAEQAWNDPQWKERLKQVNQAAIEAGVFGAPFFVIDGEPFWGNDRREQMERWLAGGPFGQEAPVRRKTAQQLVDEAMAQVRTLSLDEARALHGREDVLFVDVRDVRELEREGMVPGALHAPRGMLEFWADPASPYHKPVFAEGRQLVLFCGLGWRSALATKTLQDMGVPKVAHIEGGFTAWKEAGAPVAEKPKKG